MAIFKCKMCGGALEINNNETVAVCEYCGTQQTLPKLDDNRKANLYDRANHFRRNNEFDKAMGIYEQILNEDNSDAESYWSLVLCRYGIEYVEDPSSHKRVPTVNRAQFTSVFDDEDYKSALKYADSFQKEVYEAEAKVINEIQKGILAISQQEEPFDVFICYKETDSNGRRTQDSVIATELYHELTREGYKVFFSRITLEDKLGTAYEPYIFAALNSSKVMVVLGTKPEYFNAVWVKNEWSRYLALIKNGEKKILIPAYRDMDPYDLPEEFSHLQAQDMTKLGFMQDLIRGINKLVKTEEQKPTVVKETVVTSGNVNVESLLKRVFIFLDDKDWKSADEYCEKVLDIDPENAQAYLGKLMAELRVCKKENLKDCAEPFDTLNNYQKAVRFGDDFLKKELSGYIEYIITRNENARLEGVYKNAVNKMNSAKTESDYKKATDIFKSISTYKDSAKRAADCIEKAEIARKDDILNEAKKLMEIQYIGSIEDALTHLKSIPEWKNADELIIACQEKIIKLNEDNEKAKILAVKRAKKTKKLAIITTPIICAIIAFVIVLNTVIIPYTKYNNAIALMNSGKYADAILAFENLDDYKDSADKIIECNTAILDGKYDDAIALMDAEKYTDAIAAFKFLDGYKDSDKKITECNTLIIDNKYNDSIALMQAGNIIDAYESFISICEYKDSADLAKSIYDKYKQEKIKIAKVGDYVFFGAYEQDNNISNGKEEIEWLVLDIKDGKALVISKYALDCKFYNTIHKGVTWETCSLRTWMNNEFFNSAFSGSEKAIIPTVTVSADINTNYNTNSGNATQDKIFLLSVTEADKYFNTDSERACNPTSYAVANGDIKTENGMYMCTDGWWLRTPGESQDKAAYIEGDGYIYTDGTDVGDTPFPVNMSRCGLASVRPAMWISIE